MSNDTHEGVARARNVSNGSGSNGSASNGVNGRSHESPETGGHVSADKKRAELTVIIPCYNERNTVLEVIKRVRALPIDKEIIVVDNCSTDGTRDILVEACKGAPDPSVIPTMQGQRILRGAEFLLILQPRNFRKGTSVKTGVTLARGEFVVCQDADLEYEPGDIVRLLEHAKRREASAVFGSRLSQAKNTGFGAFHLARVGLTHVFRVLYWSKITDVATCYKLMKTDVAQSLGMEASGFELDFEIPAKLRRQSIVIDELPIAYHPRSHADGKKIGWRDGVKALWTMAKHRVL
jgi:dolichol-phosphate mannosyltransferase